MRGNYGVPNTSYGKWRCLPTYTNARIEFDSKGAGQDARPRSIDFPNLKQGISITKSILP
jgi:hypothetical protein